MSEFKNKDVDDKPPYLGMLVFLLIIIIIGLSARKDRKIYTPNFAPPTYKQQMDWNRELQNQIDLKEWSETNK